MIYITKDKSCVFIINYKCCYSTFEDLTRKRILFHISRRMKKVKRRSQIEAKIPNLKNYKLVLIVRNPLGRLISFYCDKFINRINRGQYNLECQTKMYKFFPLEYIKNGYFTFSNLLEAIKKGYKDKHMHLQNTAVGKLLMKDTIILKMEDIDFSTKLKKLINTEILPHRNKTDKKKIIISESDKAYIYKFYKSDFIKFNYPFEVDATQK